MNNWSNESSESSTPGLLPSNHPMLHEPVDKFKFQSDGGEYSNDSLRQLKTMMYDIMCQTRAIGLSANQIGLPFRIFTMHTGIFTDGADGGFFCVNPSITFMSNETISTVEGCLSFPGLALRVRRAKEVKVHFQDELGQEQDRDLKGMLGRCFQHELDHLNGITFDKQVSKLVLAMAKKKAIKGMRTSGLGGSWAV